MVKKIYLLSMKAASGKSAIAIGLFLKLKDNGYSPGYFKPIGDSISMEPTTKTDKDVAAISVVLARKYSKEEICPVFLNPDLFLDEVMPEETADLEERIKDAFHSVEKKSDYVIIEGNHKFHQFRALNMDDTRWAKEFDAEVIICTPIRDDDDINDVIGAYDYLKLMNVKIAGVVLNGLNESAYTRIEKYHKKILEKRGITVIGGLKEARQLQLPTISEVMNVVGGKLLTGNFIKIKYNTIDNFIIGAMGTESALSYMRKSVNSCVITGGDRTDIALAAIETNAALILLTGNIEPSRQVISKAEEKGVPLVLAPNDTFTVSENLKKIHTHIQPNEIEVCRSQVEKYIDWNKIPK